jgi:hypothetical protein
MDDARDGEVVRRKPRQHIDSLTAPEREAFLKPLLPAARLESCDEDDNDNDNNDNNNDDDDDDDDDGEPSPAFAGDEQQLRRPRRARAGQTRTFLKTQFYLLVYTVVHTLFALYLRLRRAYHAVTDGVFSVLYYHHRTPELIQRDVKRLGRLPEHLSVIVTLKHTAHDGGVSGGGGGGYAAAGTALEQLMDEVAEIAAWCACAGIPALSVYEKTGVLKSYMATLHRVISAKLHAYCGRQRPSLQLRAPHVHPYMNGDTFDGEDAPYSSNGVLCLYIYIAPFPNRHACFKHLAPFSFFCFVTDLFFLVNCSVLSQHLSNKLYFSFFAFPGRLSILLISAEDGRDSIVDLTKTLAEMAQRGKVNPDDISLELIDIELSENVMAEPDLLIVFSPYVDLQGYPPWQVRLTEIL